MGKGEKMEDKSMMKYIYGAGKYGRALLRYFQSIGCEIDFFVQTETSGKEFVDGIRLKSINEIEDSEYSSHVFFVAISNHRTANDVKIRIKALDLNEVRVYDYGRFVEDNLLNYEIVPEGSRECIICGSTFEDFKPAGTEEEIFSKHHIIGGGYRKNALCPCCGSLDRERWQFYVLNNKIKIIQNRGRILHFAPEKHISHMIRKADTIDYYTGDIVPGAAMHVTDITDIQYKNDVFDYVISNHVMEHIVEEEKAVSEIKRVLKPTGKWIFSFPICMDQKTYEDDSVVSQEQRLQVYGQKDHVRLYGNDFKERFEKYGLKLQIFTPRDELTNELIEKWGLIVEDIVIIATLNIKS